jgi:hypothetical protein
VSGLGSFGALLKTVLIPPIDIDKRLPGRWWQEVYVRGDDDPLGRSPVREDPMPDVRRPGGQEADLRPREDLLVTRDAQIRDGSALGCGGDRRLELEVEDCRRAAHVARPAAVVMIGHAAARRRDVRPGGVDCQIGCGDPVRLGEDGRAAARPREKVIDGRPAPILDNVAGVKEPGGNPRRVTPAAPVEGAGSPLSVDLLEQGPAERVWVGMARLDEPLAERALQRDPAPLADRCRLDAARRGTQAGHGGPPHSRRLGKVRVALRGPHAYPVQHRAHVGEVLCVGDLAAAA